MSQCAAAGSAAMFQLEHPSLSRASPAPDREENSGESEQENWSQLHSFSFPRSGAQNRCGALLLLLLHAGLSPPRAAACLYKCHIRL